MQKKGDTDKEDIEKEATTCGHLCSVLLGRFGVKRLAKIWGSFNSWDFPENFPLEKPSFWDKDIHIQGKEKKLDYMRPIQNYIKNKIGLKECLRDWNKKDMPGKIFDNWWGDR